MEKVYELNDHLGTPRQLPDGAQATLAKHSCTPYGVPLSNAGLPIHVGYTGHTWNKVTSQWFAPYRYYNSSAVRWGWQDPLRFADGLNMFKYTHNNPIAYIDLYGREGVLSTCYNWIKDTIFGGDEDDEKEDPAGDQVENILDTTEEAIKEIILDKTPGMPSGLNEAVGAAEAAPAVGQIFLDRRNTHQLIDDLAGNEEHAPIPDCGGGGRNNK